MKSAPNSADEARHGAASASSDANEEGDVSNDRAAASTDAASAGGHAAASDPVSDPDEIERLKVRRIEPPTSRLHLPILGAPTPPPNDIDEAYGGRGEPPQEKVDEETLRARIVDALKQIYDPEIPVNIYDLGLIYGLGIDEDRNVEVAMTLTAPACPVAGILVQQVAERVGLVEGVGRSHVKLVWDPPWTKDRMTEEALLELGML